MEASYDLGIFLAERSKAIAQLVQSIGTNWSHGSALGTNKYDPEKNRLGMFAR